MTNDSKEGTAISLGSLPSSDFSTIAAAYDSSRQIPTDVLERMVTGLMQVRAINPSMTCIDLGCGTGQISAAFLSKGFSVTGVDISNEMGRLALMKLEPKHQFKFIKADVQALPFLDQSFDLGVTSKLFMHIGNWQLAAEEIIRVLKPGGILINANEVGSFSSAPRQLFGKLADEMGYTRRFRGELKQRIVANYFASKGAKIENVTLPQLTWSKEVSWKTILSEFEQRIYAEYWGLDPDDYQAIYNQVLEKFESKIESNQCQEILNPFLDVWVISVP